MQRRLILELEEQDRDIPGLAYALAMSKHNDQTLMLDVDGFTYEVKLHKVTVDHVVCGDQ